MTKKQNGDAASKIMLSHRTNNTINDNQWLRRKLIKMSSTTSKFSYNIKLGNKEKKL